MKSGFIKKLFSTVLAAALAVSGLGGTTVMPQQVYAQETVENGYEIYPTPQSISYQDGSYAISDKVSVAMDEGIDEATKNRLDEILQSKGKKKDAQGETKIYLGIYNSKKAAAAHIQEKYEIDEKIFSHEGAHYVISDKQEICILGKDTDAVFYGLTSLKHIFNQMADSTIRNFTIKDYANTSIRGFIEGYYGIPWSNEDRMSLMEFGGDFKMTSYVFAPKDDPYHSSKWRELYPQEILDDIKEMASVGNAAKCRFVWTIHPFMHNRITEATYDNDIRIIKEKFQQLYDAGVRQFGVLGDDAGNLPRSVVIRVMNDLQKWVDSKGDVYDLVFCPQGYNDSWQGNYAELNEYDAGFDPRIKIFWTGQAVCQPIEQKTLTNFRTKNLPSGKEARRAPLFWLNWPVNDINMSRLMMGKGSLLHPDINAEDLAGAVTNPMQDAQASKVAIFAVADFTWNIAAFNDDVSWQDSFKYIDAEAAEPLYTLAKHMSDPSPNGHGLNLAESEELKPLLDEFMALYEAGTYDAEKAEALAHEFEVIAAACDDFHKLSKNEGLKAELLPFTNALKDLSNAVINLFETAKLLEDRDDNGKVDEDAVWLNYSEAGTLLKAAKNHDRKTISGTQKALPGSKWITPFAEKLNALLAVPVNSILDDTKVITSLITNRTDTPAGALESLTDNNEATQVIWKNPTHTKVGDYIGLSFSQAISLEDVTFKMGQSANERDTFQSAKLQYTEDGKTWVDIEGTEYSDRRTVVSAEAVNKNVKGIRLIATADVENMWLGCKDIVVNGSSQTGSQEPEKVSGTGIYNTEEMVIRNGNVGMMTDGQIDKSGNNYVGFAHSAEASDPKKDYAVAGAWVGIEFAQPTEIGSIFISQGTGDHIDKGTLEYTADGKTWTEIGKFDAIGENFEEEFAPVTAKAIRLVNNEDKAVWWRIYEVTAKTPGKQSANDKVYTNVEELKSMAAVSTKEETSLKAMNGITLKPNEYVGVKLDRIKDITEIKADSVKGLTLQSSKNAVVWTNVADSYEDARYVRLINLGKEDVTFDLTVFKVKSYELEPISIVDKNISFYGDGNGMKAFDNDRTTEVIFNHSQVKGDFVTYDLGQMIDLHSIALVSKDGAGDFPRHAKLSVSENGTDWTEVLTIGDQDAANKGEAEGIDDINDVLPLHEVSFNVKRAENLELKARFVKFEITRTKVGPDKWTRYTEIELNGRDMFLPSENNPTITTASQESYDNVKGNLIDGDVSTTFRPVGDAAGSFTYHLSENTDRIKQITMLQGAKISGAEVTAEVIAAEGEEPKTVVLGKLDSSLKRFAVDQFANILSVTVTWEDGEKNVPLIHEIICSEKKAEEPAVTLKSIKVTAPAKTTYEVGEALDTAGMKVVAVYSDGSEKEVATGYVVEDVDMTTAGTKTVKVTYQGKEASFEITVNEKTTGDLFPDVTKDDYFYNPVKWAVEKGVTSGVGNTGKFMPHEECTRANIVTFLWRVAGKPTPEGKDNYDFADVPADAYYAEALQWAYENKIVQGYGNTGKFMPDAPCTRANIVTFLWRAEGTPTPEGKDNYDFADVPADAYYAEALQWAFENGIVQGYGNTGKFMPDYTCTRAQSVTYLYRVDVDMK